MAPTMSYYHYRTEQAVPLTPKPHISFTPPGGAADYTIVVLIVLALVGLIAGRMSK